MTRFSSVLGVYLRFFMVFQFWNAFWRVLGVSLEFRWWNIVDFSTFRRFSLILTDLVHFWMRFWRVLAMPLEFFAFDVCVFSSFSRSSWMHDFYSLPTCLCDIFRKISSKNTWFFRRFSLIFNTYFGGHLAACWNIFAIFVNI